jgi:putative DNA primase/helicase
MMPFDAETIAAEAVAQTRGEAAAGEILGFRVLTVHELLTLELPPRETVLHPWLPSKGIAMVFGPRGIGKTHITLSAAYAIASGGRYLRWHAPKPRRVLVLDGEMPGEVLQLRLAAIAAAAADEPFAPDYLRVLALDLQQRGLDLGDKLHQDALDHALGDAEVIFCDNISTLANAGRENEAESWLPVQEWSLRQRRAGRSIVFMHHAGKGGQQRGTSRREDVLDTVIALRRPADHQPDQGARFEVHYEKSRGFHGEDAKPFEAALGAAGWATRDLADVDLARVATLTSDGLSVRDIETETGFSKSRVSRLQQKAREAGLIVRAGHA